MELIKPSEKYLNSYYQACTESWGYVHDNYILHNPNDYNSWKETIFKDYENAREGKNLPDGFVPNITYWCVENDKYIGTVNIRLTLTPPLVEYGGTLGIVIRKSERGNKLGLKIAELAIEKLHELKINQVLLTCEESNTASWKIIEKLDYKKKELYKTKINGILTDARRYWL